MSKEKIIEIKLNDGEVIHLEEDVNDISVDIKDGVLIFYNKYKREEELFCTPVGSIKYYRFIPLLDKPVETQEEERTCSNCRYDCFSNCCTIVGECIDYDKWEPEE